MQLMQDCKTARCIGKSLPYLAGMNPPSRKQFCCMMYVPLHTILPGPWDWPVKEASGNSPGVWTGVPTGFQQGASRVPAGYVQNPTVPGTLASSPRSRNNMFCSLAGIASSQPICNLLPPARYGRDFLRHLAVLQSCRSCTKPKGGFLIQGKCLYKWWFLLQENLMHDNAHHATELFTWGRVHSCKIWQTLP
jgi:hypothetical protein